MYNTNQISCSLLFCSIERSIHMKKLCSWLLALLLVLSSCAMAEGPVLLWEDEQLYLSTFSDPVQAVKTYSSGKSGIMSLDGQVIVPCEYDNVTTSNCVSGYFIVAKGDDINCASLVDLTGAVITSDTYGNIEMLNEDWVIAVKIEVTTSEDYDYWAFGSSDHFNLTSADVYHIPSGGKVGTFSRADYHSAIPHGDHLLVRNREGGVQLYDTSLTPVDSEFTSYGQNAFYRTSHGLERDLIVSRITGETVARGYSYVNDVYCDKYIDVSNEDDLQGLIDDTGTVLLPCEYDDIDENLGYLQLEKNGLIGLYDLEKQSIVVPCEYTALVTPDYDYVNYNGYFLMEKDGKIGFVSEDGIATTDFSHDQNAMTLLGCTMIADNGDGTFTLIAADGIVTALTGVQSVDDDVNASLGRYILVENAEGMWGIIDWHGNQVVDYTMDYYYDLVFVDMTHLIVDDHFLYELK